MQVVLMKQRIQGDNKIGIGITEDSVLIVRHLESSHEPQVLPDLPASANANHRPPIDMPAQLKSTHQTQRTRDPYPFPQRSFT